MAVSILEDKQEAKHLQLEKWSTEKKKMKSIKCSCNLVFTDHFPYVRNC